MYCRTYEIYINKLNVEMESKPSSIKRLLSLKINKGSGVDDFSFNIIEKCFGMLCELLIYLFQLSLVKGLFPDDLKIAKVTLIYKTGIQVSNCRPISVLPCFSKILERLMYNRLYKYFFFHLGFVSQTFTNHRTAREGGGHSINSLPLPPASQALRH